MPPVESRSSNGASSVRARSFGRVALAACPPVISRTASAKTTGGQAASATQRLPFGNRGPTSAAPAFSVSIAAETAAHCANSSAVGAKGLSIPPRSATQITGSATVVTRIGGRLGSSASTLTSCPAISKQGPTGRLRSTESRYFTASRPISKNSNSDGRGTCGSGEFRSPTCRSTGPQTVHPLVGISHRRGRRRRW